jgi:hypothetical protein
MSEMRGRWLASYLILLHVLVLVTFWRRSEARIAESVLLVSAVPLALALKYLVDRFAHDMTWLDFWVLAYALWSVTSAILYFQADAPSQFPAYAYGLYHFVVPIACYFAGKSVPREHQVRIITTIVLLNFFALAYGVYMHVARPDYYTAFLQRSLATQGAEQEWQLFARMQSYIGSTSIGYMGAATVVLVTLTGSRVRNFLPIIAIVCIGGTVLTLQRASLVALGLALFYLAIVYRPGARMRILLIATFAAAASYGIVNLHRVPDIVQQTIAGRLTTDIAEGLVNFFRERGYDEGMEYLRAYPFGAGLGATSSAAHNAGYVLKGEVADANFMRIAADLGPVGLVVLLLLLSCAAWRATLSRHPGAWLAFLAIHCGIMLSTNVFDSFYISHCFWLLLAFLDCDRVSLEASGPLTVSDPGSNSALVLG